MGVRYSASESANMIQAMSNNVHIANEITDRLSSGCRHLIQALDSGSLQGAAYTAGKGLFTDIIIPAVQKLQLAIDDIAADLATYQQADQAIAHFGTLDQEQLQELKVLRERQLQVVLDQIAENEDFIQQVKALFTGQFDRLWSDTSTLYRAQEQLEMGIQSIEEQLQALDWFVTQTSGCFTDSLTVLQLAIQGALQLSHIKVDSDGSYFTTGLDMTWLEKMKGQALSASTLDANKHLNDKEMILYDLMTSYGLNKNTALALYELQQAIIAKGKREGWSNEQIIYEYNRIVASFDEKHFVAKRWTAISGTMNEKDRDILCRKYGLSASEIKLLKDNIPLQHNNATYKDLSHEAVQLAAFTEKSWKFDTYALLHLASTLANTGRIPIAYTTASVPIPMEKYEISFKGDVDSGRFGDADFNSDLDAINTYTLMQKAEPSDIFTTQSHYHTQVLTDDVNRVQTFYETMGNGDAVAGKRMVDTIITMPSVGSRIIQSERDKSEEESLAYFYDYLKRGEVTNVK